MARMIRRAFALSAIVGTLGFGLVAVGGDLTPPAGPVNPTMKDLDDVEPRGILRNNPDGITPIVINQSGSYKLGENIQAIGLEHGIEIVIGRVSIDLNGFEVIGSEIGSLDGIHVAPGADDITIHNGRIRLFTGAGIGAAGSNRCRIEAVDVQNTFAGGIVCGDHSFVDRCSAQSVTVAFAVGISVGASSRVMDCSTDSCYTGILAEARSQVTNCNASASTFAGYYLLGNARPTGCVATGSGATQYGIYQDGTGGGEIANNVVSVFLTAGIRATAKFQIHDNTIIGSDLGGDIGIVIAGGRNFIFNNSIDSCSNGLDLGNFCEQEVYANRLSNVGSLAINNCATLAPEEQADSSTNPHANLR